MFRASYRAAARVSDYSVMRNDPRAPTKRARYWGRVGTLASEAARARSDAVDEEILRVGRALERGNVDLLFHRRIRFADEMRKSGRRYGFELREEHV